MGQGVEINEKWKLMEVGICPYKMSVNTESITFIETFILPSGCTLLSV